jgi:hypothetical protein
MMADIYGIASYTDMETGLAVTLHVGLSDMGGAGRRLLRSPPRREAYSPQAVVRAVAGERGPQSSSWVCGRLTIGSNQNPCSGV